MKNLTAILLAVLLAAGAGVTPALAQTTSTSPRYPSQRRPMPGQPGMSPDDMRPGPMRPDPMERRRELMERLQRGRSGGGASAPRPRTSAPSQGVGGTRIVIDPEKERPAGKPGESKRLRLDLKGLDILEVLKIFSKQTGLNIVAGSKVKGRVTMFLEDVDMWEAFEAVLQSNNLTYVQRGDVVEVMPAADYERHYGLKVGAERRLEVVQLKHVKPEPVKAILGSMMTRQGEILSAEASNSLLLVDTPEAIAVMKKALEAIDVPSRTEVISLNYAKVEDMLAKVQPLVDPVQGTLQADLRTNRLMVTDSSRTVSEIMDVVKAFDIPHKEVLIEAKIIQVNLDDNFQFGVNWNYIFDKINTKTISGAIAGTLQILPTGSQGANDGLTKGVSATVGQIPGDEFSFALSLLKTVGDTNLLSSPRITALNGEEASILVGTKEAYVTTTVINPGGSGATTTSEQVTFVAVGVKLFVTPFIGDDGFITMKIKPEVSGVQTTIATAQGNSIPIVRESSAETTVMVKNGTTIVIGGLIEDRKEQSESRVPVLGKIPLLGFLFRSRSESVRKSELVIFLTPTIITGDEDTMEAKSYENWPEPPPMPADLDPEAAP